jgi:hypothetical protein
VSVAGLRQSAAAIHFTIFFIHHPRERQKELEQLRQECRSLRETKDRDKAGTDMDLQKYAFCVKNILPSYRICCISCYYG